MGSPDPPGFRTCAFTSDFFDKALSPTSLFQRLLREGHTRSLSEHGSQASHRRWYLAHGPGRVGRRWIHAPLMVNRRGGFFVLYASARMNFISTLAFTTGQYRSLMAHGPLPSDGERGPSFYLYRFCKSIVLLRPCSVGLAAHEKAPTRGNLAGGFFALSALISVKNDYFEYFAHLRRSFSKRAS